MTGEPSPWDSFVPPASISFGRFEEECLSWERRSPFSHNRYLEEAEKCTSPGSISQKKAFFETHFKEKDLPYHVSVDFQNGGIDRSNEYKIPNNQRYMIDLGHVPNTQHSWFDEEPKNSNENKLKAELQLCDFESTLGNENDEVVTSLLAEFNAVSAGFVFVMEDKLPSAATSSETHQVYDKHNPILSPADGRDLEDGHVNFPNHREI